MAVKYRDECHISMKTVQNKRHGLARSSNNELFRIQLSAFSLNDWKAYVATK